MYDNCRLNILLNIVKYLLFIFFFSVLTLIYVVFCFILCFSVLFCNFFVHVLFCSVLFFVCLFVFDFWISHVDYFKDIMMVLI